MPRAGARAVVRRLRSFDQHVPRRWIRERWQAMRWTVGWRGGGARDRRPVGGQAVSELEATWTCGWPAARVRAVSDGRAALAVVGECGADSHHLRSALPAVRSKDWRALTRWPGSYLVVAHHGGTVAVIGDLTGQHPVFWRTDAAGTWWATAATALAALDGAPVDSTALAAHLAFGQPDVLGSRSLFRGVRRVPGGHALLLYRDGTARVQRYEPVQYAPVDLRQHAPVVRAALTEAVAARIDGRTISADLAGLDSTTLACLAAQHAPVTAVTIGDKRLRDDDVLHATRTAASVRGLAHHTVPGDPDAVYYAGLDDVSALPVTDSPNAYAVTASIMRSALDTVTAHTPPGVHFTGAAGDAVLSAPSSYLADLLRERRHRRAWSHALAHARLRHTSPLAVLARARPASQIDLRGTWVQAAGDLRRPARPWIPQAQRPVAWTPLLTTADWMSADARDHLAGALDQAAGALIDTPGRLADWSDRQDLARVGANTAGWRALALAEYDIELSAPFLDNEVVRSCLSVPADQRGAPGRYKPLLDAAFAGRGVMPEATFGRTTKGGFNALSYAGLRAHAPVLRELVGPSSHLAALGLVTEAPFNDALARATAGQPTAQGAIHLVVSAEVWLRQLATAPVRWWQEVKPRVAHA
ncbi:albusnodin/ikarugamycin family macrolactam cyclase [Streptomyces buecherae]|uniref:albusnodin/ikarugamycin family macrolactam cyclase n=1 Tax=Streptomyces buecherae TaxID=2763006 RepID=UPI0036969AC7